jgi:ABC-type sulfate transport system permease subunit
VTSDLLHQRRRARTEIRRGVAFVASVPVVAGLAYLLAFTAAGPLSIVTFMMYFIAAGTFGAASILVGAIRMRTTTQQLRLEAERIPKARLLT